MGSEGIFMVLFRGVVGDIVELDIIVVFRVKGRVVLSLGYLIFF